MGAEPTRALWSVGPRIAQRLSGIGIGTVRELAGAVDDVLAAELGARTWAVSVAG